jgi:hypothetical protein
LYTGCNKSKVNKKNSKSEYGKLFSDYLQAGENKEELFQEKGGDLPYNWTENLLWTGDASIL